MFFFHGNRTPLLDLDWPTSYKFKFEEVDWLNRILTGREKGWEGGAGDLVMFQKKGYSYGWSKLFCFSFPCSFPRRRAWKP